MLKLIILNSNVNNLAINLKENINNKELDQINTDLLEFVNKQCNCELEKIQAKFIKKKLD